MKPGDELVVERVYEPDDSAIAEAIRILLVDEPADRQGEAAA